MSSSDRNSNSKGAWCINVSMNGDNLMVGTQNRVHFYAILDTTDVNNRYSGRYKGPEDSSPGTSFLDVSVSADYQAFWAIEMHNDYAIAAVYQGAVYIFRKSPRPPDHWIRDIYNGTDTDYYETIGLSSIKYFKYDVNTADHAESASIFGTDAFVTGHGGNPKSVYHFTRGTSGWEYKQTINKTDLTNASVYSSGNKLSSQVWSKGGSISQFSDNVLVANNWVFVIDTRGNSRKGYIHSYYKGTNGIYDISNVSLMAEGDNNNDDFGKIAAYHNNTLVLAGGSNSDDANYIKIYSLPLDGASSVTTQNTVITNNIRETLKIIDKGDISGNDASFNNIQFLGKILKADGTEFVGGGGGTTYDSTTDIIVNDISGNDASFNNIKFLGKILKADGTEFTEGTTLDSTTDITVKDADINGTLDVGGIFSGKITLFGAQQNNTGNASLNGGMVSKTGTESLAFGRGNDASTDQSVAIGNFNKILVTGGKSNVALGDLNYIQGTGEAEGSVSLGDANMIDVGTSNLKGLVAIGHKSYVGNDIRFAIGVGNTTSGQSSDTTNVNATSNSNKLVIDKDGNVGVGINTPGKLLEVAGDMSCNKLFVGGTEMSAGGSLPYNSSTDIDVSGATVHKNAVFKSDIILEEGDIKFGNKCVIKKPDFGEYNLEIGLNNLAQNDYSVCIGTSCLAMTDAIGSMVVGGGSQVHSAYSVAVGQNHEIQAFSPGSFTSEAENVINLGGTSDKPGGTALGYKAWVGNDIRFAIGISDSTVSGATTTVSNNKNRFVIDKNGKVGIGSSFSRSPGNLLEVVGDISCNELYVGNTTKTNFKVKSTGDISGNDASFNNIQFLGKILKEDGTEFVGGGGGTTYDSTTDIDVSGARVHKNLTIGGSNGPVFTLGGFAGANITGDYSLSIGNNLGAGGGENFIAHDYGFAVGYWNWIHGDNSGVSEGADYTTVFGYKNKVQSPHSLAVGLENTIDWYSRSGIALGAYNYIDHRAFKHANSFHAERGASVALGHQAWVGNDLRFAIGTNDTKSGSRAEQNSNKNRFVIDKNGKVGIGASFSRSPGNLLEVVGDISCNELYVGNTTKTNFKIKSTGDISGNDASFNNIQFLGKILKEDGTEFGGGGGGTTYDSTTDIDVSGARVHKNLIIGGSNGTIVKKLNGNYSLSIGNGLGTAAGGNLISHDYGFAVGYGNFIFGSNPNDGAKYSVAFGQNNYVESPQSLAVGYENTIDTLCRSGIALGRLNTINHRFGNDQNNHRGASVALGSKAWVGKDLRFAIGTSGNDESQNAQESSNKNRFVIDKNGKVGIGASFSRSPGNLLEVVGDISCNELYVGNTTNTNFKVKSTGDISGNDASFNNIQFLGKILKADGTEFTGGTTLDSTTDITVKDATLNGDLTIGNSNQVVIKTTGGKILNTGIGINSTYSSLNLQHTAFGSGSTSDSNSYAIMQSATGDTYLNCASGKHIYFREGNNQKMILDSGGNVGIGTLEPGNLLEVVGDISCNELYVGDTTKTNFKVKSTGDISGNDASFNNIQFLGKILKEDGTEFGGGTTYDSTTDITVKDADINGDIKLASTGRIIIDSTDTNFIIQGSADAAVNISGTRNVIIGHLAAKDITSGKQNNIMGFAAAYKLTTGSYNNIMGDLACGNGNMTGNGYNNIFGRYAAYDLTSGTFNNIYGYSAAYKLTTGSYNNILGRDVAYEITTGEYNNIFGREAAYNITSGKQNNIMGYMAGKELTTGSNNNILGERAGNKLTTGSHNNIIGKSACGNGNMTGIGFNNIVGYDTAYNLTSGRYNNIIGSSAGYNLTTGEHNNILGRKGGIIQRLEGGVFFWVIVRDIIT